LAGRRVVPALPEGRAPEARREGAMVVCSPPYPLNRGKAFAPA